MPIYEYECTKCSHHFDKRQSFDDEVVAECPKCKNTSNRILVPAPVIFKGSGFYVTDYRKGESCSSDSPKNCCSDTSCKKDSCPSKN
jgi:putative FmdB family regulatory protein